jgi:hypothetical protein
MDEIYERIAAELHARQNHTYFQQPDKLVISRQRGPVRPDSGNSFWISNKAGIWYLCTWAPAFYRVAADADLVSLCSEFVACGTSAQARVPDTLIERYRLTEIPDAEAHRIFG